ncbi:hypothetical protein KBZ21_40585, partial [Streptomyces sp. A73]|nr:hypothetical protein [Streptomyces sp. A73]
MAEKDKRTYVKVHDGLPDHPKIIEAGGEAGWLYICGLAYSSRLAEMCRGGIHLMRGADRRLAGAA